MGDTWVWCGGVPSWTGFLTDLPFEEEKESQGDNRAQRRTARVLPAREVEVAQSCQSTICKLWTSLIVQSAYGSEVS